MASPFTHPVIRRVELCREGSLPPAEQWGTTKFSVLIPTYESNPYLLDYCIKSVLRQLYPHWELIVSDDGSRSEETLRVLDKLERSAEGISQRVVVIRNEENVGLGANLTRTLDHVQGEFVALLDHDDFLLRTALADVAAAIEARKDDDIQIAYTDQLGMQSHPGGGWQYDDLGASGPLKWPFDPVLFAQTQYLNHLTCIRTDLARQLGGWSDDYDGSQDYEFLLRALRSNGIDKEGFDAFCKKVLYVPWVGYVWRHHPGEFSWNHNRVALCNVRAVRALQEHVDQLGWGVDVLFGRSMGMYHLRPRLTEETAQAPLTMIVPCNGNFELLYRFFSSLYGSTRANLNVIVLADATNTDRSAQKMYKELPTSLAQGGSIEVVFYRPAGSFNFSYVCNLGAAKAQTEYIMFVNNDIFFSGSWIEEMYGWIQQNNIGVVGMELRDEQNHINHAGIAVRNGEPVQLFRGDRPEELRCCLTRQVLAVTGAAMMTKKSLFEELGGFDERYCQYYQDVAYCLKVWQSKRVVMYTPYAKALHKERASFGPEHNKAILAHDTKLLAHEFDLAALELRDLWSVYNARHEEQVTNYGY